MDTGCYVARLDAVGFRNGEQFDLGGVAVTAVHLAGHMRGHCSFLVARRGLFFVGDVEVEPGLCRAA